MGKGSVKVCAFCGNPVPPTLSASAVYCGEKCRKASARARGRGENDRPFARTKPSGKKDSATVSNWVQSAEKTRADIAADYPFLLKPMEHSLRVLENQCREADSYGGQTPPTLVNVIRQTISEIQKTVLEEWNKIMSAQSLSFEDEVLEGVEDMSLPKWAR